MSARMTPDDRYEIAARAEAGERSNRPIHLVFLAGTVLAIALFAAAMAWRSDASAANDLRRQSAELAMIQARSTTLAGLLQEQVEAPENDQNAPIPDMRSRLRNAAQEAGLDTIPGVPATERESFQNARRVNYRYSTRDRNQVRDPSLEKMLNWVSIATERIPGLHVRQISLKPQANSWMMEVTFARYERIEE
ncbi:MAG: hypothetical protein AAGA55_00830 [Planctomycetota bacterium]